MAIGALLVRAHVPELASVHNALIGFVVLFDGLFVKREYLKTPSVVNAWVAKAVGVASIAVGSALVWADVREWA